jgi:hypothetical protein
MCDYRDAECHRINADPMAYGHPKVCGHRKNILQPLFPVCGTFRLLAYSYALALAH